MGWLSGITSSVSDVVGSLEKAVSNVGKATGLDDIYSSISNTVSGVGEALLIGATKGEKVSTVVSTAAKEGLSSASSSIKYLTDQNLTRQAEIERLKAEALSNSKTQTSSQGISFSSIPKEVIIGAAVILLILILKKG
jgi:hypothetical protein